jgi:hypothetical protein
MQRKTSLTKMLPADAAPAFTESCAIAVSTRASTFQPASVIAAGVAAFDIVLRRP